MASSKMPFQSLESTPLKLESAGAPHSREALHRRQFFWLIPAAFSVLYIILGGTTVGWHRLGTHWSMTITAVFASFIAGASPEGGSSVFFPVLTVILDVSPAIGRSFGLCIQTIGMSVASLRILITGIPVDWNVIFLALPCAAVTQLIVLLIRPDGTTGEDDAAFLPPFVDAEYVQVRACMHMPPCTGADHVQVRACMHAHATHTHCLFRPRADDVCNHRPDLILNPDPSPNRNPEPVNPSPVPDPQP